MLAGMISSTLCLEALVLMLEREDIGARNDSQVNITRYLHLTLCAKVPDDVKRC